MLLGTRVPHMVGLLATQVGWPRRQPGQPQPAVSPSCGADAGGRGDRRPDSVPVALTVAELQTPIGRMRNESCHLIGISNRTFDCCCGALFFHCQCARQ